MAMVSQCSICLSSIKEPVSIPCGHVYCTECLGEHINSASADGYTSTCPTCRTEFPIVSPERTCLPKQVQKFLFPVIRRVYLPDTASQVLQAENQRLQNLLNASHVARQRLEDQVGHLMEQCERHMSSSAAHAKGEKDASMEVERLRRKLEFEMSLRKAAEEDRDAETRRALKVADLYQVQRAREVQMAKDLQFELDFTAKEVDRRSRVKTTMSGVARLESSSGTGSASVLLASSPLTTGDDSEGGSSVRRPVPISQRREAEEPRRQNPGLNGSHPSPITRPTKRHLESSNSISEESDSDSDSDFDVADEIVQVRSNQGRRQSTTDALVSDRAASSAITPRRRVLRQLPPRPPTKRIRA